MSRKRQTPAKGRRPARGKSRSAGDLAKRVPHRGTGGVNLPGYTETLDRANCRWRCPLLRTAHAIAP